MPNKGTKGKNVSMLQALVAAGKQKEELLTEQPSSLDPEQTIPEDTIMPTETEKLTEKEERTGREKGEEEKLTEKTYGDRKEIYTTLMQRRVGKEPVDKTNILTHHRDMLKSIAAAEKTTIQDLLANILDNFHREYKDQIKQSTKKLLL